MTANLEKKEIIGKLIYFWTHKSKSKNVYILMINAATV